MGEHSTIEWIAYVLLVIGGLNWGLVGAFNFNLVTAIVGTNVVADIIFILVGLAALFSIIMMAMKKK